MNTLARSRRAAKRILAILLARTAHMSRELARESMYRVALFTLRRHKQYSAAWNAWSDVTCAL